MVATSHDVMPDIELYQPTDEANALDLANTLGSDGWLLAGGQDTFGWLKDRNKSPAAMIELTQIDAWKGVRETAGGIEIGAVTTLTEIAAHPLIRSRYGLLAEAAAKVASPQIRNVGTLGGNVANGDPGNDMPAVMQALDATYQVAGQQGAREIKAREFYEAAFFTALNEDEILTAIDLPARNGWRATYRKLARRGSFDFPVVGVAAAVHRNGDGVEDARIFLNAVASAPLRATEAETAW